MSILIISDYTKKYNFSIILKKLTTKYQKKITQSFHSKRSKGASFILFTHPFVEQCYSGIFCLENNAMSGCMRMEISNITRP